MEQQLPADKQPKRLADLVAALKHFKLSTSYRKRNNIFNTNSREYKLEKVSAGNADLDYLRKQWKDAVIPDADRLAYDKYEEPAMLGIGAGGAAVGVAKKYRDYKYALRHGAVAKGFTKTLKAPKLPAGLVLLDGALEAGSFYGSRKPGETYTDFKRGEQKTDAISTAIASKIKAPTTTGNLIDAASVSLSPFSAASGAVVNGIDLMNGSTTKDHNAANRAFATETARSKTLTDNYESVKGRYNQAMKARTMKTSSISTELMHSLVKQSGIYDNITTGIKDAGDWVGNKAKDALVGGVGYFSPSKGKALATAFSPEWDNFSKRKIFTDVTGDPKTLTAMANDYDSYAKLKGYAKPVTDFIKNNPYAASGIAGAGLGLGGGLLANGVKSMFGGGGNGTSLLMSTLLGGTAGMAGYHGYNKGMFGNKQTSPIAQNPQPVTASKPVSWQQLQQSRGTTSNSYTPKFSPGSTMWAKQ